MGWTEAGMISEAGRWKARVQLEVREAHRIDGVNLRDRNLELAGTPARDGTALMARMIPIIHVDDIDAALEFHVNVLGCEIDFVWT
ncbi:MAG: hypothetical protein R3A46_01265 [Thermomicrobiales bacterium]